MKGTVFDVPHLLTFGDKEFQDGSTLANIQMAATKIWYVGS